MNDLIRIENRKDESIFKLVDISSFTRKDWDKFKRAYLYNKYFKVTVERN